MSNISQYLPEYLREIREFKEICSTEDIEIERLNNKIDEIINEVKVQTAKGFGLVRYEKIFNIINTSSDIEERRFKIKSKLVNQLPFNINWLRNKLKNLVGAGNYRIDIDSKNYKVTIQISHIFPDIAEVLIDEFRNEFPANLLIVINLFQTETAQLYIGSTVHVGDIQKIAEVS